MFEHALLLVACPVLLVLLLSTLFPYHVLPFRRAVMRLQSVTFPSVVWRSYVLICGKRWGLAVFYQEPKEREGGQ